MDDGARADTNNFHIPYDRWHNPIPLALITPTVYEGIRLEVLCFSVWVSHQGVGTYTASENEVMGLSGFNRHPWLKWEQVEKFLGQKLPFGEKGQTFLDNMTWAEGYVQDMLKKAMPGLDASISSSWSIWTEIFETHEHVIIKVKIAKDEDPRAFQVFVKSNQIKLTGFLSGKNRIIKFRRLCCQERLM